MSKEILDDPIEQSLLLTPYATRVFVRLVKISQIAFFLLAIWIGYLLVNSFGGAIDYESTGNTAISLLNTLGLVVFSTLFLKGYRKKEAFSIEKAFIVLNIVLYLFITQVGVNILIYLWHTDVIRTFLKYTGGVASNR